MTNRNSIIDKIKALLAKTTENGCTEEEALAALAKARAWIDAHEVTDDELQLSREEKAMLHDESEVVASSVTAMSEYIATVPKPVSALLVLNRTSSLQHGCSITYRTSCMKLFLNF
jgi:hypothetical protein